MTVSSFTTLDGNFQRSVEGRIVADNIEFILKTLEFLICHSGAKLLKEGENIAFLYKKYKIYAIFARIRHFCVP